MFPNRNKTSHVNTGSGRARARARARVVYRWFLLDIFFSGCHRLSADASSHHHIDAPIVGVIKYKWGPTLRNLVAAAFSRLILCQALARDNALCRALQTIDPRTNVRPTNLNIRENKSRTCNSHIIIRPRDIRATDFFARKINRARIND